MTNLPANIEKYESHYSESSLWEKIKKIARKVGREVVYHALLLYYALDSPSMTLKDRAMVLGALGYLILPADLIPDFLPVVGYTDDAAALYAVLKNLGKVVDDMVKAKARAKTVELLGE